MSCRKHYQRKCKRHGRGVIYRVTNGIAEQFGFKRKWVIAGFIIGLIIHAPLTILMFFGAMFLLDHPQQAEPLMRKVSNLFSSADSRFRREPKAASATPAMDPDDFDFSQLRREFEDLERRTGDIERHVTSEEFELHQEFNRMKDGKD